MATWTIRLAGDQVTMTYRGADGTVQECGRSERILLPDVIAFASDQADPFDIVRAPDGVFVRQTGAAEGSLA